MLLIDGLEGVRERERDKECFIACSAITVLCFCCVQQNRGESFLCGVWVFRGGGLIGSQCAFGGTCEVDRVNRTKYPNTQSYIYKEYYIENNPVVQIIQITR